MASTTEEIARIVRIERIAAGAAKVAADGLSALGQPIDAIYCRTQVVTGARGSFQVQVIVSPYTPPENDEGRA